ncbi:MAG: hypothetical protein M5R40_13845 [Anaerolineae bacterium]|nr:hypothetical protein [Anaerolineae bacterium]
MRRLSAKPGCDAIYISFEPNNAAAERLYRSLGFADTGRVEGGEIVYRLALDRTQTLGGGRPSAANSAL